MQDIPTFALMMKDEDSQEDKGQAELDDRNQKHQEWNNNRAKGTQKEQEENVESTPSVGYLRTGDEKAIPGRPSS